MVHITALALFASRPQAAQGRHASYGMEPFPWHHDDSE